MFEILLPYILGILLVLVFVILGYEIWARITGKLYTPRHARETKKKLLRDGERLVMKIEEPHAKQPVEIPPVPLLKYSDLYQTGRVRGSICVRRNDLISGTIDPRFLIEMIFSRARAAGVKISVEAYEDLANYCTIIRWWPDERPDSNTPYTYTI